ncbi:hypothetical protein R5R35_002589 [Gryllus longicercus]|uniref:lysozyme n=1 Tax=Gryllus longicercus TaxID=2509291 RepID=A0AAN9VSP9_9ORTH
MATSARADVLARQARQALVSVLILAAVVAAAAGEDQFKLPALHRTCLRCLCEASSGCDRDFGCQETYCGPFGVSRIYWHEAGRPVLPHDDPDRKEAYADCAQVYKCASLIVTQYMNKLAKDCNGDGRVNCDDFAMSHHNGGYSCHLPLNRTAAGQKYLERYLKCRGKDEDDDPLGLAVAAS